MNSLLPLSLGISPTKYAKRKEYQEKISPALKATVLRRDLDTCRFCGFRDRRYQEVIALKGNALDTDDMVTACIFCGQCLDLDRVAQMHSGILVWLPDLDQVTLNHLARDLYRARNQAGATAERAERIIDFLGGQDSPPRLEVRSRIVTDDPGQLAQRMAKAENSEESELALLLWGLRLFPLNRRHVREGSLEYNQFPQISAHWCSPEGPFGDLTSFPYMEEVEESLFRETDATESVIPENHPLPELINPVPENIAVAVNLMRDAATFFRQLADQNPPIREEMRDNADVYDNLASLLEADPKGSLEKGARDEDSESLSHVHLASQLLHDAGEFFMKLANQNPGIKEQMMQNAQIYQEIGEAIGKI